MEVLHVVYASTLVRTEHVVLLLSLTRLPYLLATSRYRASSRCFVDMNSLLVQLLFSGAPSLLCLLYTSDAADE